MWAQRQFYTQQRRERNMREWKLRHIIMSLREKFKWWISLNYWQRTLKLEQHHHTNITQTQANFLCSKTRRNRRSTLKHRKRKHEGGESESLYIRGRKVSVNLATSRFPIVQFRPPADWGWQYAAGNSNRNKVLLSIPPTAMMVPSFKHPCQKLRTTGTWCMFCIFWVVKSVVIFWLWRVWHCVGLVKVQHSYYCWQFGTFGLMKVCQFLVVKTINFQKAKNKSRDWTVQPEWP